METEYRVGFTILRAATTPQAVAHGSMPLCDPDVIKIFICDFKHDMGYLDSETPSMFETFAGANPEPTQNQKSPFFGSS